jgi:hypothetical protein
MPISIKVKCLLEPQLQFSNGRRDVDPRRALSAAGPVDHRGLRTIRVGLIGLSDDVSAARLWIATMASFKPARERNARRFRDWPGAEKALGARFEVDDQFIRMIDRSQFDRLFRERISGSDFDALVDLFEGPISGLFGDVRPDCIVVCIPDDLGDLRVDNPGLSSKERRALEILKKEEDSAQIDMFAPSPEEMAEAEVLRTTAEDLLFRTFYRALKAKVHKYDNAVPIQILRRGTIDRDEESGHSQATRSWNFAIALYYKSGGLPWRPADLPEGVCFIGVSFHHLKKRGAFSMMRDILDGYEKRTGVKPKRVVVHKTSLYQPEEEEGASPLPMSPTRRAATRFSRHCLELPTASTKILAEKRSSTRSGPNSSAVAWNRARWKA